MKILTYNSKMGRYEVHMKLEPMGFDSTVLSNEDMIKMLRGRQLNAHREVDTLYEILHNEMREENLIK